jgi:hypothetical protein
VCAEGSVVVLVVSTKAETTAFARFLADPPDKRGLGCWDALNLDGGPSTQLVVKLPTLALSSPRGSGIPNALVVAPGKGQGPREGSSPLWPRPEIRPQRLPRSLSSRRLCRTCV